MTAAEIYEQLESLLNELSRARREQEAASARLRGLGRDASATVKAVHEAQDELDRAMSAWRVAWDAVEEWSTEVIDGVECGNLVALLAALKPIGGGFAADQPKQSEPPC